MVATSAKEVPPAKRTGAQQVRPSPDKQARVFGPNGANHPVPASTDSGTVACAASRGADELAKPPTPWGVESPEVAPSVPGSDATPTPSEVQRVIKQVAANVVATLPAFFDDHKADLEGLDPGLIASTPPYAYDALSLPMTDAAFDFITYGFGPCSRQGCMRQLQICCGSIHSL